MQRFDSPAALILVACCLTTAHASPPASPTTDEALFRARVRVASIHSGKTFTQVRSALGDPDEVRPDQPPELSASPENATFRFDLDQLLFGSYCSDDRHPRLQAEHWAYGVLGRDLFAAVGIVTLDRSGSVLAVHQPDDFAEPGRAGDTPSALPVTSIPSASPTSQAIICTILKAAIHHYSDTLFLYVHFSVQNRGSHAWFAPQHPARHVHDLIAVELRDNHGVLLSRRFPGCYEWGADILPGSGLVTATIPAGGSVVGSCSLTPHQGHDTMAPFGRIPPGRYSLRLLFKAGPGTYTPSEPYSIWIGPKEGWFGQAGI